MNLKQLAPFTLFALAAVTQVNTAMADGFYGVGEVTHTTHALDRDHFDTALSAGGAAGLTSKDDSGSNQWRLQGGYQFNDYIAVEGGYIDFGETTYKANFNGGTAKGSLKAGGADIAAVFSVPVNDTLSVFAKAGVVAADIKAHLNAGAPVILADRNTSATEVRPLLGVGAVYKISRDWDLRADYDQVDGLGKSGSTGTVDAKMLSFGVVYKF